MSIVKTNSIEALSGGGFPANLIPATAKAWCNWNGAGGAIHDSYNVSSVSDTGTGSAVINFTTAMSDTNFLPMTTMKTLGLNPEVMASCIHTITTSSVMVVSSFCHPNAYAYRDFTHSYLMVFGD